MSLCKIGSSLSILKTAATVEDLLVEKPTVEATKPVISKVIEPKNNDFLYYRARCISAGDQGPLKKDGTRDHFYNGNKDYFPRQELEASYQTLIGRNIFLDHNSESSLYSIGKIIDALPIDDKDTGEFYIEIVGKIDRTLHPEIARKIETGELNSTSMGCSVDESICSICGNVLHSDADDKCNHMSTGLGKEFPAEVDFPEYGIVKGSSVPCFSINKGIVFNEDSIVGVPADHTALIKTVLSNMKSRMNKKASLSKEEQIDLASQMENVFSKLDEGTKAQLKADLSDIFPAVEKESSMADKNLTPNDETKKILNKISAYEMEQLESYVTHKTKKANDVAAQEIVADSAAKEESFLSKIVSKVKAALATEASIDDSRVGEYVTCPKCGQDARKVNEEVSCSKCGYDKKASVTAKFTEDKNNVLDSTWSVEEDGKTVLEASLSEIWGSDFEIMSFSDQLWATSADYAKEIVSRYTAGGVEKLASDWDVKHKLSKTAADPKLGPSGPKAKPTTGLSNKKHDYPTNPKFEKPGQESAQKGPAAPASKDVKTVTKIDMPGQEKGQTGPAAPKAKEVKTDYSDPKPEAGKEVKTTPKNPDEKKHDKSEKEVKTDYVAKGTEAMEAEDKGDKTDKKASSANKESAVPFKDQQAKDWFYGFLESSIDARLGGEKLGANEMFNFLQEQAADAVGLWPMHDLGSPDSDLFWEAFDDAVVKLGYGDVLKQFSNKRATINYKKANVRIKWSALSPTAQDFIKKHVEKHIKEDGMERAQAVAAAYSEAREKGMDVPAKKSSQETDMKKQATDDIKSSPSDLRYVNQCLNRIINHAARSSKRLSVLLKTNPEVQQAVDLLAPIPGMAQQVVQALVAPDKQSMSDRLSSLDIAALDPSDTLYSIFETVHNIRIDSEDAWQMLDSLVDSNPKVKQAMDLIIPIIKTLTEVEKLIDPGSRSTLASLDKQATDAKPDESVDGSTLPEGKKSMGDKVEESVQGTTVPGGAKPSSAPETSAQGDKEHKTPNLTKAPDQAVDGTTLPPQGKKDEESAEKSTHPDGKKTMGDESEKSVQASKSESFAPVEAVQDKPALSKATAGDTPESAREGGDLKKDPKDIESVNKKAATEMPMPEDKPAIEEDIKMEEKPMDLPLDGPKVDMPKEEVSAFDKADMVDVGEGYSAHKDHETKEVIIEKDGKEVKRLPDGFGAEMTVVLPLLKAVLGLPVEDMKQEMPGTMPPAEDKMEAPKEEVAPVPAAESHEDEFAMKESALKLKEAALAEKEAAILAKEAAIKEEEKVKRFASVLQARQERCKKIVSALVEKDAISMDKEVYDSELKIGTYLLDAQKKAFEHAIVAKQKELMAMDDNALLAAEAVIADIKVPTSSANTKRASRIYVSPSFGDELSEDQMLKKIFDTFGTKNRPQ
jgi:hypothetical protein